MTLIEHLALVEETRSDINRKHDLVVTVHQEWVDRKKETIVS